MFQSKNYLKPSLLHALKYIKQLFHGGGPYRIETSTLICRANQWTGFYTIGTSVMKEFFNEFTKKLWIIINNYTGQLTSSLNLLNL